MRRPDRHWITDRLSLCKVTVFAPVWMLCAASMTAFKPEAHTLLTVEQTVDVGRPAPSAACLVGA